MFSNVIPKSLNFFDDIEKLAGVSERQESYLYPETGNNAYGPQQSIIRFRFNAGMLDLRDSQWEFTATCSSTGGTYCRFSNGIFTIVNRVRLLIGSQPVIDTIYFNQIFQLWLLSMDPNFITTTASILWGVGSQATRNSDATNPNRFYNLNLSYVCELLGVVWPADFISDQISLEIYLEDPNRCIETDGTSPTYVVNTNQYHYGVFKCTQDYLELVNKKIASGGIMIPYKAYDNYVSSISSGISNIQNVIPFKRQCLLGITYCMRNALTVASPATNDKFLTFVNYPVYNSSRLKINDTYYPNDRVLNTYEAYIQNLEYWCVMHTEPVDYGTSWPTYFVLSQSISQNPRHIDINDVISGVDTSMATSTITAELVLNTPGTATNQEFQYYGYFYGVLYIKPNKTIQFQQ
jgi:hypothetical protein